MGIESLLAFFGTPYLDTIFHKPFHDKRCFVIFSAQTVKHENKKNIKGSGKRFLLNFLNSVSFFCRNLVTGNALLRKLFHDCPALLCSKFTAALSLHWNIIFFNLPQCGYTIQANHTCFFVHSDSSCVKVNQSALWTAVYALSEKSDFFAKSCKSPVSESIIL